MYLCRSGLGVCVYPWGIRLQGAEVIFQSKASATAEQSVHPGHVGFYELLSLPFGFLLQSLHLLLEVLQDCDVFVGCK